MFCFLLHFIDYYTLNKSSVKTDCHPILRLSCSPFLPFSVSPCHSEEQRDEESLFQRSSLPCTKCIPSSAALFPAAPNAHNALNAPNAPNVLFLSKSEIRNALILPFPVSPIPRFPLSPFLPFPVILSVAKNLSLLNEQKMKKKSGMRTVVEKTVYISKMHSSIYKTQLSIIKKQGTAKN